MATTARADAGKAAVAGLQRWELANGSTRWRLRWRANGAQQSIVFDAPDLRKARSHARALLESVEAGHDPRPSKRRGGPLTLGRALWLWLMAHRRTWRPRSRREYIGLLKRRLPRELRARPLRSIQRPEIRALLAGITAKGHRVEANRCHATLRAFYRWVTAVDQEHLGVTADATAGLTRPAGKEKPRDRVYSDVELAKIMTNADPFLRFVALTGARESEARALDWSQVDLSSSMGSTWRISAAHAKSGVARLVPLSEAAHVLLTEQRAEYAKRPWRASRDQKAYKALSEKLGFAVRPHDLRRTLGQWVKDKYGPAAMHAVLGHAELTLTRTYGPAPSTERVREIMELWSDYYLETLARVLAGDDQADVGQIRRILEERKIARKLTAMTDEQVRELIEGARR